ncbi:MAG TPA: hypothetical protein VIO32_04555 [Candidatus Baltobacteraceae bacterium]
MKRLLACAAWGAAALAPVAAAAVPTTVVRQATAPVQIQSCSALVATSRTPYYSQSSGSTGPTAVKDGGRIVYYGYPQSEYTDSGVTSGSVLGGTHVYASAQSVNQSGKTVSGVVYEFNVMKGQSSKPAAVFYGGQSGDFAQNIAISPPGLGLSSPWATGITDSRVGSVVCLIAYVRFRDGTEWTSPLAIMTK